MRGEARSSSSTEEREEQRRVQAPAVGRGGSTAGREINPGVEGEGADADMKAGETMDTGSGAVMRPKDVNAVATVVRGILQTCCIRRGRRGRDVIWRVEARDQLRRLGCKAEGQGGQQGAVRWTWTSFQSPWGGVK